MVDAAWSSRVRNGAGKARETLTSRKARETVTSGKARETVTLEV